MLSNPHNIIVNLSDHLKKSNSLKNITQQLLYDHNIIPCFGVEIEFFLSKDIDLKLFEEIIGIKLKKEKGDGQFEIDLPPSTDLEEYVQQIYDTKSLLAQTASKLNGNIDFTSKPFLHDYGNGLHFHLNFLKNQDPELLNFAAQSLCHFMLETFLVFLPREEDYLRLDKNFMTPTTVSFGGNNRTVSIRIPDSLPTRLEHRIANSSTDPYIAMFAILKSILLGLENPKSIKPMSKIYGNGFDEQYNLQPLPKSRTEALKLFNEYLFS